MARKQQSAKITGTRWPRFTGARELVAPPAASRTTTALFVCPIMAGETVFNIRLDAIAITKDEDRPDQMSQIVWALAFHPEDWMGQAGIIPARSTTAFEAMLDRATPVGGGGRYGGDPNPGGDLDFINKSSVGIQTDEVIFLREVLTRPQGPVYVPDTSLLPGAQDALTGRTQDHFRTVIRKRYAFSQPGWLIFGCQRHENPAQTDFGAADIDTNLSVLEFLQTVKNPLDPDVRADADSAKLVELLYAGDQYIEADTLKARAMRGYVMARIGIATPFPLNG